MIVELFQPADNDKPFEEVLADIAAERETEEDRNYLYAYVEKLKTEAVESHKTATDKQLLNARQEYRRRLKQERVIAEKKGEIKGEKIGLEKGEAKIKEILTKQLEQGIITQEYYDSELAALEK